MRRGKRKGKGRVERGWEEKEREGKGRITGRGNLLYEAEGIDASE